jgi:hypothetical protein
LIFFYKYNTIGQIFNTFVQRVVMLEKIISFKFTVFNAVSTNLVVDALMEAIIQGDLNTIRSIELSEFDFSYLDENKNNILQKFLFLNRNNTSARYRHQQSIIKAICAILNIKGFNLNSQNANGDTFLHTLCCFPFNEWVTVDILNLLVNRGVDFLLKNQQQQTPLMLYCMERSNGQLRPKYGLSLDRDVFEILLKQTQDINAVDVNNCSIIHYLAKLYSSELTKLKYFELLFSYKPDLNIISHEGEHLLDFFDKKSQLYSLLIDQGAKDVPNNGLIKELITQQKEMQIDLEKMAIFVHQESILCVDKNKVETLRKSPDYIQLAADIDKKIIAPLKSVETHRVYSVKGLNVLKTKYGNTHHLLFNENNLDKGEDVLVCPKIDMKYIATKNREFTGKTAKRSLGWALLARRLNCELAQKPIQSMKLKNHLQFNCYDFTDDHDSMFLAHATTSNPKILLDNLTNNTCFNNMIYFSCSLVTKNNPGFRLLSHSDSPFRVFFILKVDPEAILAYSTSNLSCPYSRGSSDRMMGYFGETLKQTILANYLADKIVSDDSISFSINDAPTICAKTGVTQLASTTGLGLHNEILVMGNQFAQDMGAEPVKIIAIGLDKEDLERAVDSENARESLNILKNSKLPILLFDFNQEKEYWIHPNARCSERIQTLAEKNKKEYQKLFTLIKEKERLGNNRNDKVDQQLGEQFEYTKNQYNFFKSLQAEVYSKPLMSQKLF